MELKARKPLVVNDMSNTDTSFLDARAAAYVERMSHNDPVVARLLNDVDASTKSFQTNPSVSGFAGLVEKSNNLAMKSDAAGAAKIVLSENHA